MFLAKDWNSMNQEEKKMMESISEDVLRSRWSTEEGKKIKNKIIEMNLKRYVSPKTKDKLDYSKLVGTIRTRSRITKVKFQYDLRGIDFSEYSNLINDEIFCFDFSQCNLEYSNFTGSHFSSSDFNNSNILYSNFEFSILDTCNFSNSNMTLSNFDSCNLSESNFKGTWLSGTSLSESSLSYVKFNNKTDFHDIDTHCLKGDSSPLFISYIRRKNFLNNFKEYSIQNKIFYYVWKAISDCGQSFTRWFVSSLIVCGVFGLIYSNNPDLFFIANDRPPTSFTYYYYSIVTFTTLGFGDIIPNTAAAEIMITIEVILGYLMLGGLISILSTKFIPKE